MDKIIYKKRDWVKGELITEEKIDNIEIGIEQADKTIDQFKDEFSPMKTKNDLDEARVDIWSNTFSSLKQRLDSDYFDIAKDVKIYKNYSLLNREDSIRNTADGNVSKILVKGRTENGKSVGEDEGYIIFFSTDNKLEGSDRKESIKKIKVPKGGLKSVGDVYDSIEQNNFNEIILIKRISDDFTVLERPEEIKIYKNILDLKVFKDFFNFKLYNEIKPEVEFSYNDYHINDIEGKIKFVEDVETIDHLKIKGNTEIVNNKLVSSAEKENKLIVGTQKNDGTVSIVGLAVVGEFILEKEAEAESEANTNTLEIDLPIENGLKKINEDIYDYVEQRENGAYLIQKVGKLIINGNEEFAPLTVSRDNNHVISYIKVNNLLKCSSIINDKYNSLTVSDVSDSQNKNLEYVGLLNNSDEEIIYISIERSKLSLDTVEGFKNYIKGNPITVYYEMKKPITSKIMCNNDLLLETFKGNTHIVNRNNVYPIIETRIPYDASLLLTSLQEENLRLKEENNELENKINETKTKINSLNYDQTASKLDLDMRLMSLELE